MTQQENYPAQNVKRVTGSTGQQTHVKRSQKVKNCYYGMSLDFFGVSIDACMACFNGYKLQSSTTGNTGESSTLDTQATCVEGTKVDNCRGVYLENKCIFCEAGYYPTSDGKCKERATADEKECLSGSKNMESDGKKYCQTCNVDGGYYAVGAGQTSSKNIYNECKETPLTEEQKKSRGVISESDFANIFCVASSLILFVYMMK